MESTTDAFFEEARGSSADTPPRLRRWIVLVTGAVCFLLFELTANPGISVAVACVEFGWDQFRKARWLRRHDPDPIRARVCHRFYLASGFWKMSLGAMLAIGCLTAYSKLSEDLGLRARGVVKEDEILILMGAILVIIPSLFLATCLANAAVVSALREGIMVWVGRRSNQANLILASALVVDLFALAGILSGVVIAFAVFFPDHLSTDVCALLVVGLFLGLPLLVCERLFRPLKRRLIAETPEQCGHDWPGHTSPWLL